jgi:hypothetical protein
VRIKADVNSHVCSQEILIESPTLDEVQLPMRPVKIEKQLVVSTMTESIATKKKSVPNALLYSGCTWTCVDEEYTKTQGWPLQKIAKPIQIDYADGSSTEQSMIRYMVNLRLKVAGATVVTGRCSLKKASMICHQEDHGTMRSIYLTEWYHLEENVTPSPKQKEKSLNGSLR